MKSRLTSAFFGLSTVVVLCLCASTLAADPAQMRPLLIQTNWEIADDGVGLLEMSAVNNGVLKVKMLYRFQGNRLLLCFSEKLDGAPTAFAAKGTKILELMPYQQDRIVKSCRRPEPKPEAVFQSVAPPQPPPPPPPQPKNRDE